MRLLNLLPFGAAFGLLQVGLHAADPAADPEDLVQRLKAREPRAMAELYEQHGPAAYSLVLRIVRNSSVAEDLMEETFIRVWNRIDAFPGTPDSLGVWILTLARSLAVERSRLLEGVNHNHLTESERPYLFAHLHGPTLSPDYTHNVKRALRKLSDEERAVIDMVYYEGLSEEAISVKLKQSRPQIDAWLRSAIKTIREQSKQTSRA